MKPLQHDPAEIARAVAKVRRALEARIAEADKPEKGLSRSSRTLSEYDWRGLWDRIARKIEWDGRGWRAVAEEIGVTAPDLSRVKAGQPVAANKVLAICAWADLDPWRFYKPARGARHRPKRFTGIALKQRRRR